MVTKAENELMTLVEGDAPMGMLMRENYWIPFAPTANLVHGDGPLPVRLFGENYVAFRGEDGSVGFLDELCPHRRASLALGRVEGNAVQCIYHGWKIDTSGCVVECPTQTIRTEQFMKSVPVKHFPVHECGGIAWVWLGGAEAPPFPDLPFADEGLHSYLCVSRVPCNWLQGMEGSIDSVHAGFLHKTWLSEAAKMAQHSNLTMQLAATPTYETQATEYGMRAAALRKIADGGTYVRITEHLMPFVSVVPVGGNSPRAGSVFVITPVDDTHHLLFFGYYGETEHSANTPDKMAMQSADYTPHPLDYVQLEGDRLNKWGQDRNLMGEGHWTGFGRSLLEEDAAVQASMGQIVDRTKETLSSSDTAVAHARRMLLDAVAGYEKGELPPGSARRPGGSQLPNCIELVVPEGERWEEASMDPAPV